MEQFIRTEAAFPKKEVYYTVNVDYRTNRSGRKMTSVPVVDWVVELAAAWSEVIEGERPRFVVGSLCSSVSFSSKSTERTITSLAASLCVSFFCRQSCMAWVSVGANV